MDTGPIFSLNRNGTPHGNGNSHGIPHSNGIPHGKSSSQAGPRETGRIINLTDGLHSYCKFLKDTFKNITEYTLNTPKKSDPGSDSRTSQTLLDPGGDSRTSQTLLDPGSDTRTSQTFMDNIHVPLKIVVDCSNGAASSVAPLLFIPPLFDAHFINHRPDGKNINLNCGSQHTEALRSLVTETGAAMGLAFDGDADRLIAVDETGAVITGDRMLALCAAHAKKKGRLENNLVVSTVMSNIGLLRLLDSLGIDHIMTDVGDREVLREMTASGAIMGGEDSGHMIFSRYHTTGDGLLSALRVIEVMMETGTPLSELASIMKVYPQVLMNVEVDASRPDFMAIPGIKREIDRVENQLGKNGRVLVRYSGTQPLLRVMVEGPDPLTTESLCRGICNVIRDTMLNGSFLNNQKKFK
ncbi:MAG: phosphoglucosamine mutase [Desulfamplus sp.]|nr:phosphoglucosamine mutase [Desulfamplus sp.]